MVNKATYTMSQKREVLRYFEEIKQKGIGKAHDIRVREALTFLKIEEYPKDIKVLDIGCRDGRQLEILESLGFSDISGLDIVWDAVERARRSGFIVTFGDVEDIRSIYKRNNFDLIIATHVVEHCINCKEIISSMREILKKDGILFIEVPTGRNDKDGAWGHYYNFKNSEALLSLCEGFSLVNEYEEIRKNGQGVVRVILKKSGVSYAGYYKEKIQKRFDKIQEWPEDHKHIKDHFRHIFEYIELTPRLKIFDVGTRDSWSCKRASEKYGVEDCIGVEILNHYVEHWKRQGRKIEQGDVCDLGKWHGSGYDIILCRHMINLSRSPFKAISEMVKISKEGSVIYIVLAIPGNRKWHYSYVETKSDVLKWVDKKLVDVLYFGKNPYAKEEYSLVLKVRHI